MLSFELPVWLRAFRGTRLWSLFSALVYNIVYGAAFYEWYTSLYDPTTESREQEGLVDIFISMVLGYNLFMHSSIAIVNTFIIFKEWTMEYYQFIQGDAQYALNENDAEVIEVDLFWFISPFTWIDIFWELFFGYDAEDIFWENPDDEEHYYENW